MCFFVYVCPVWVPFHMLMCLCVVYTICYYRLDGKLQAAERQHGISHQWTVDSAEHCYAKEALVTRKKQRLFSKLSSCACD